MVGGHAEIKTKAEYEAYREIRVLYLKHGKSNNYADCVENILRISNATSDFQDFTKLIDPETNINRLVDHLQLKAANNIQKICENEIISYVFTLSSSCATDYYRCNLIIYLSMFLLLKLK